MTDLVGPFPGLRVVSLLRVRMVRMVRVSAAPVVSEYLMSNLSPVAPVAPALVIGWWTRAAGLPVSPSLLPTALQVAVARASRGGVR